MFTDKQYADTAGLSQPPPAFVNSFAQIEAECIRDVLGFLPGTLDKVSREQRQLVRKHCSQIDFPREGISFTSFDSTHDMDTTGVDPGLVEELQRLDNFWSQEVDNLHDEWAQHIDDLHENRELQSQFWSSEFEVLEAEWQTDIDELNTKLHATTNPIYSLRLEQAIRLRDREFKQAYMAKKEQRALDMEYFDQEIAQAELEREREGAFKKEQWGIERQQVEEAWILAKEGLDQPEPDPRYPVEREFQALRYDVPDQAPIADRVSDVPESIDLEIIDVRENTEYEEPAGPHRGFFVNSSSSQISGIDGTLDPTSLAVIGILLTLSTAVLSMARGR